MLNVPNILSIVRILLVPTFMVAMHYDIAHSNQVACFLFAVASLTDMLDGHIARKYKLVTNLGKVIDPVADKILVTAAMIMLVEQGKLASWIVVLMLLRDFAVGALRDVAAADGTIIAAGIWGKLKTVLQMIAISFILFYDTLAFSPKFGVVPYGTDGVVGIPAYSVGAVLIIIALITSIFSGIVYFIQFKKVFSEVKH